MAGKLNHSPARVIQQMLIDLGHVTDPPAPPTDPGEWPAFVGIEPDLPNDIVVVSNSIGRSRGSSMVTGERFEHVGIQVLVRSLDHNTGYNKADDIGVSLDEEVLNRTVAIDSDRYLVYSVGRTGSGILYLGKSKADAKRSKFSINALLTLKMLPP